jgi:hypothetical protein
VRSQCKDVRGLLRGSTPSATCHRRRVQGDCLQALGAARYDCPQVQAGPAAG